MRVRHGLVTLLPAEGWVCAKRSGRVTPPRENLILQSPRGSGRFELDTVEMPKDMDAFDLARLTRLVERRYQPPFAEALDESAWEADGVAVVARSRSVKSLARFMESEDSKRIVETMPAEMRRTGEPTEFAGVPSRLVGRQRH